MMYGNRAGGVKEKKRWGRGGVGKRKKKDGEEVGEVNR